MGVWSKRTHFSRTSGGTTEERRCMLSMYKQFVITGKLLSILQPVGMAQPMTVGCSAIRKFREFATKFGPTEFLVGDGGYPGAHWLVTPFRNNANTTNIQRAFNTQISRARVAIEQRYAHAKLNGKGENKERNFFCFFLEETVGFTFEERLENAAIQNIRRGELEKQISYSSLATIKRLKKSSLYNRVKHQGPRGGPTFFRTKKKRKFAF